MLPNHRKIRREHTVGPMRIGLALCVLFLAISAIAAQPARADGIISLGGAPLSTLVKFGDRDYEIAHADWVSLEPISQNTVRKIEYGRVSEVNVATTATGTYSSDGMVSPHIRYPGIDVTPQRRRGSGTLVGVRFDGGMMFQGRRNSMLLYNRTPGGGVNVNHVTDRGIRTCVAERSFLVCQTSW
jgi:hypothetical protein